LPRVGRQRRTGCSTRRQRPGRTPATTRTHVRAGLTRRRPAQVISRARVCGSRPRPGRFATQTSALRSLFAILPAHLADLGGRDRGGQARVRHAGVTPSLGPAATAGQLCLAGWVGGAQACRTGAAQNRLSPPGRADRRSARRLQTNPAHSARPGRLPPTGQLSSAGRDAQTIMAAICGRWLIETACTGPPMVFAHDDRSTLRKRHWAHTTAIARPITRTLVRSVKDTTALTHRIKSSDQRQMSRSNPWCTPGEPGCAAPRRRQGVVPWFLTGSSDGAAPPKPGSARSPAVHRSSPRTRDRAGRPCPSGLYRGRADGRALRWRAQRRAGPAVRRPPQTPRRSRSA
jgi:hypothetical protein